MLNKYEKTFSFSCVNPKFYNKVEDKMITLILLWHIEIEGCSSPELLFRIWQDGDPVFFQTQSVLDCFLLPSISWMSILFNYFHKNK